VNYDRTAEELQTKAADDAEKQRKREAKAEAKRKDPKDQTFIQWLSPWS